MRDLKDNVLFQFSALSLAILTAIALTLAFVLSNKIRSDAIEDLVDETVGAASGRLVAATTPDDFQTPMTGDRYKRFHDFVRNYIISDRTAMVKLWSTDSTVIFSDDIGLVGEKFPDNEPLQRAVSGEYAAEIKVPVDPENERDRELGTLMELYTPVYFAGSNRPQGVFEIYQYYGPTARRIDDMRRWVFGSIATGFLVLYGSLVFIAWRGWRTITEQRSQLRAANSELETRVKQRTADLRTANYDLLREIAGRERAQAALAEHSEELARSNTDLEQFAYAASHDLQEPLRAVAGLTGVLARRHQDTAGDDPDDLVARIVNAAARMQTLISDLLTYSRVGRSDDPLQLTDCDALLDQEIEPLQRSIVESGAVVTHDALPAVMGSAPLLSQVFGNLIGNSLKFRGEASPRVHISAERRGDEWVFSVADNGLGIDPDYADRIFVIFQRLHTREEYPGTGIGLAICKKAVERLGGRIWVESQPGQGTTFFFTVPVIDGPGLDAVAPDSAGEQRSGTPSGDDHPVHGVSHGDTRGSRDKPNNSDAGKLATAGL